jgi:hypothetical protein
MTTKTNATKTKTKTAKPTKTPKPFTPGLGVRLHWLSQPEQQNDPVLQEERKKIAAFLGVAS